MQLFRVNLVVFVALVGNLHAQTVISNINLEFEQPGAFGGNFGFNVWQDAGKTDHTRVDFNYNGTQLSFHSINLDEGSDWYVVQPGDIFSPATIQSGAFPAIVTLNDFNNPPVSLGTGDFYLGVATERSTLPPSGPRTVFGWVQLHPTFPGSSPLSMVGNVMSYNSPGIIVGTTTVVPEPTTIAMVACGLAMAIRPCRTQRK
jgi:hypothetical protein